MALPAVTVSLVAGLVLAAAPASSAATSAFTVTEIAAGPLAAGIAVDPATSTVYAGITGKPWGLAVINSATSTVISRLDIGMKTSAVAVDPTSDTVYDIAPGLAKVINGKTNAVIATIKLPAGSGAGVAVNPKTHRVYVTDGNAGTVAVIDGKTNTLMATISVGDPAQPPRASAGGVAVDATTNTIYVADAAEDQIAVISGATNTVTSLIALPSTRGGPSGVAVDPAVGLVYAANSANGGIFVIDTATDAVSTMDSGMQGVSGLALDTADGTLYATVAFEGNVGALGTTAAIDVTTRTVTAQFPRGGQDIAVMPGGTAYVDGSSGISQIAGDVTVMAPSTVNGMSPIILASSAFTFTVGQPGQDQLIASATPAANFSGTGLPAGLTLSPAGLISGTPAAGTGGSYTVNVTAANGVPPPAAGKATVIVNQGPVFTSPDHVTFATGVPGSFAMTAAGFPAPVFSETGTLPAGISMDGGRLSGTPAAGTVGHYPITMTATNAAGTATQVFTLTVQAPAVAVAALGTNGVPYAHAPQLDSGVAWQSLGGTVTAPPAVAATPNPAGLGPVSPLFIAPGVNHTLYIRGLTGSWQRLGPKDASCLAVGAVITGTTLTVACEGVNHALYYDSATMPATGLPAFTNSWQGLGGNMSAGPAVAPVGGELTFFVRGVNGVIYTRTLKAGFSRAPWSCLGAPAAAQQAATGVTVFACEGNNHLLYEATNSGAGWSKTTGLSGAALAAGPGIAATSGAVEFLAEVTTHAVWERTPTTSWTSLGGTITGGIQAAALN